RLVEDVGLLGVVQRDVGHAVPFLVFERQGRLLRRLLLSGGLWVRSCREVNGRGRKHSLAAGVQSVVSSSMIWSDPKGRKAQTGPHPRIKSEGVLFGIML